MPILDVVTGFNELELFEIRFFELQFIVDRFHIFESDRTFSGVAKPYYFRDRLSQHTGRGDPWDRIREKTTVHCLHDDLGHVSTWDREHWLRRQALVPFHDVSRETMVLFSDLDEIPSHDAVDRAYVSMYPIEMHQPEYWDDEVGGPHVLGFGQQLAYFYLNGNLPGMAGWCGTRGFMGPPPVDGQAIRSLSIRSNAMINPGGWHFSYIGGPDRVRTKVQAYAHQEFNNPQSLGQFARNADTYRDPFGTPLTRAAISTLPRYVQDNLDRFDHLIWKETV